MANIWLINHYASTPATGMGGRHHYLGRELAALGHRVTVVAARHHHLLRDGLQTSDLPSEEMVSGYRLLRLDVPRYAHAHDKRRILAWAAFTAKLWAMRPEPKDRPDVVLYSSPQLLGFLGAEKLARRYRARLVFDVRDIWPWTLMELGGYTEVNPIIKLMKYTERRAYKNSFAVVGNQPGVGSHMSELGFDPSKFTWLPNGFSRDEVEGAQPMDFEANFGISRDAFKVTYAGTLGLANAMWVLLEAARIIRDRGVHGIEFIIAGSGPSLSELKLQKDENKLLNVTFVGVLPKHEVYRLYRSSDALFLSWNKSELYKWGMSTNKCPEYFAAGKPVVQAYSGGNDPVSKFEAGVTVPAEDPVALADALISIRDATPAVRARMGKNGIRAAFENYDYNNLAAKLTKIMMK